jgi:Domain of unknown function (DUF4382)
MPWITRSVVVLALLGAGCAERAVEPGSSGPATLTIHLTDAVGDVQAAVVTIAEVYLQGTGGRTVLRGTPYTVDLVSLATTSTVLLENVSVAAGTYPQLRFVVTGAYIAVEDVTGGTRIFASSPDYEGLPAGTVVDGVLQLPSYATSGLKVQLPGAGLEVPVAGTMSLLVDFDVAQSFGHEAGNSGQWVMHPVITATNISQFPAPTGVALGAVTQTTQYGNLSGGDAFDDACPAGQAVIGYHGFLASQGYHGRIQALCGTLALTAGGLGVTVAAGETLPLRGLIGVTEWTRTCGTDEVVVGFVGRSGALIDQLTFECAPLDISFTGSAYVIAVGATTQTAAVGGTGGSAFALTECPAGSIATVSDLRAGDNLDAFGLGCSEVSLVF